MKNNNKQIQVTAEHYNFDDYTDEARWMSYYFQVKEAIESGCKSFLLIGKGDGIVPAILGQIMCLNNSNDRLSSEKQVIIDTFDFDKNLSPTYTGDIRSIDKIVSRKYDCIICCQVLEHLKWKYFEGIIKKIWDLCLIRVILSLPMRSLTFSFMVNMPLIHINYWNIIIPQFYKKKLPWNGEHYWETLIKRYQKKDILKILRKYFSIIREYNVPQNTYHWFIIMEPIN